MPAAEIILSTWKNSAVSGLPYDHLVLNDDPGAITINDTDRSKTLNNLNRQLVSTRNGLACATRHYAVKLRSDCFLAKPLDFAVLDTHRRHQGWSVLEKPVLTLNICTRHPLRRPVLFHVSDLFHLGLRSDLQYLWSAPLVAEPAFTRSIDPQRRPAVNAYTEGDFLFRCAPEQYLGEFLARGKFPTIFLRHHSDGSTGSLLRWLRLLSNNFILQTPLEAGVSLPQHLAVHKGDWDIFQPADRAWLELWADKNLPIKVQYNAAKQFLSRRLDYRRPSLATSLMNFFRRSLYYYEKISGAR
jgi:hypothetical protein